MNDNKKEWRCVRSMAEDPNGGSPWTIDSLTFGGEKIAQVTKLSEGYYVAVIVHPQNNCTAFGSGDTPETAMKVALSGGIINLIQAAADVQKVAMEHGVELIALAKEIG